MPGSGKDPGGGSGGGRGPLAGETLFLVGRMQGLTRRRLDQLVRGQGGRLASRTTARVTLIAVANSAADIVLGDGLLRLPSGLPPAAPLVGERQLRRMLGLLGPPEASERTLGAADLERLAGLSPRHLSCLVLFDVLDPVDEHYSYRDLVAAREAGRLLSRGIELGQVLEAAATLRRRGSHLAETRLTESPSGELVRDLAGQLAELSGQLRMQIDHKPRSIDELVAAAEQAELQGDFAAAEALYTTALRADQSDPVLPFNLGNVFHAQERAAEAKVAWQIAVARDPAFAEAWYNLAMAAEDEERSDLAIAAYRRAVQAWPDYADAHFNLALMLTRLERCQEAVPHWDRFVALEPQSSKVATAKRAAALCRMQIRQEQTRTG